MKEKLEACFKRLQELDIKPSLSNMELLIQTLYDLRDVYNQIKEGDDVGRTAGNSEGRDAD